MTEVYGGLKEDGYIGDTRLQIAAEHGTARNPGATKTRGGQQGGTRVLAVLTKGKPYKTWAMSYGGRRADATIPPDYCKDGEFGYEVLKEFVMRIAERIKEGFAPKGLHFPTY